MEAIQKSKKWMICLHITTWLLVFALPTYILFKFYTGGYKVNPFDFYCLSISFLVAFYVNYLLLIPRLLFTGKFVHFAIVNLCMVLVLSLSVHEVHEAFNPHQLRKEQVEKDRSKGKVQDTKIGPHRQKPHHGDFIPMVHDGLSILLVICISVLVRYTVKWFSSEVDRRELERTKYEMELKNLKNQLNPHFLFNTLNSIYALIGISTEKAQQAVIDLSELLRYVLYDNENAFVPLSKEAEFIDNYVKLMQLRLAKNVKVTTSYSIENNSELPVAQLLFISLVENAFKHGVNNAKESFIDINLSVTPDKSIRFEARNSFFPKSEDDRSGSGIGLLNLRKRLELLYPDRYTLDVNVSDTCYTSVLTLKNKC